MLEAPKNATRRDQTPKVRDRTPVTAGGSALLELCQAAVLAALSLFPVDMAVPQDHNRNVR